MASRKLLLPGVLKILDDLLERCAVHVLAQDCEQASAGDPTRDPAQLLEYAHGSASKVGSRSAPNGTPPIHFFCALCQWVDVVARWGHVPMLIHSGAAAIALDIHLEDRGVMNKAIDKGEGHCLTPYDGFGAPGSAHDRIGAKSIGGQQDDVCPPDVFLRTVAVRHHCPKTSTVGGGHIDHDPLAHGPDSHVHCELGIPKGTRTSGWMH